MFAATGKRFHQAFDSEKSIYTMAGTDITIARCSQHCSTFETCLGIFYWISKAGTPKCRGLTEIAGNGVSTSIEGHQSYARLFETAEEPAAEAPTAPTAQASMEPSKSDEAPTAPTAPTTQASTEPSKSDVFNGFALVFGPDSKRMFSTAKKSAQKAFRLTKVTLDECAAACRASAACIAFSWWGDANSVCKGLKSDGNSKGKKATAPTYSYVIDARKGRFGID